jgi:hypothetical protein
MSADKEKRTFSRVATSIKGYIRRLESDRSMPESLDASFFRPDVHTPDLADSNLHEDVVAFLKAMDTKLDMLVDYINRGRLQREYPANVRVTQLSGSGLIFETDLDISDWPALEIVLLLSRYPLNLAAAAGKIRANEDGAWVMEFTRLRESDLEKIVKFVFHEERELIREQKWGD